MTKQVRWTSKITREFEELASLNEDECYILESRVRGISVKQQSMHLNISVSSVNRIIARLKLKYDDVQKEHPERFPVRKSSAKELWMDNN